MGAAADCELFTHPFLGQPVNSLTTIAFMIAGAVIFRETRLRWIAAALVATGIGSFIFHGPAIPLSEWAHDVTLAWLLLMIASLGTRFEPMSRLPGLAVIGVVFAVVPPIADPVAVALAALAVVRVVTADRSQGTIALLGALGAIAILGRLGATGGPLCSPSSLWQWHGLWHVGAAAITAALAVRLDRSASALQGIDPSAGTF
ncbi:MAG: hypothetical protein R3258_01165 [Acidimicrobiia bacterium]|nr:hypothetical protein [Acidimicrobiia bacterium]